MNTITLALAAVIGIGLTHISLAASPATPGLSVPGLSNPAMTTAPAVPAAPTLTSGSAATAPTTASVPAATSAGPGTTAAPAAAAPVQVGSTGTRPTLGQWQDLAERQAFNEQSAKVNGVNNQQQPATPPVALRALSLDDAPKKPRRASDSCGDGDGACFYAVYGMHVDGGEDNYHGLLAIDGLIETVYKGKSFATPHGHYTLKSISTRELTYADSRGRLHTVPFSGEADEEADSKELNTAQKPLTGQPMIQGFPQR
ncbi:MAG: hypothetical protein AB1704_20070 [Pseudomonadota bacterium]